MERKGPYNKSKAGHNHNVSAYFLFKQRSKRWKFPLMAVFVALLVFGVAPVVGDEFQASLLTADLEARLATSQPDQVKKLLLEVVNSIENDCTKYKMDECAAQGKAIVANLSQSDFNDGYFQEINMVREFEEEFDADLSVNACKYDLNSIRLSMSENQEKIVDFSEKYGEILTDTELQGVVTQLQASVTDLNSVVDYCYQR